MIRVCEDKHLLDGVIGIIHYTRESINDMIFDIFVRSANQAHKNKTNSFVLFAINLKEMKAKNVRGFVIVMFLYKK